MSNKNRHIEDFFSKQLSSGSFSFEEKNWENLSQQMDAAGMVAPKGIIHIKRWLLIALLLCIASGSFVAGYYYFKTNNHTTESPSTSIEEDYICFVDSNEDYDCWESEISNPPLAQANTSAASNQLILANQSVKPKGILANTIKAKNNTQDPFNHHKKTNEILTRNSIWANLNTPNPFFPNLKKIKTQALDSIKKKQKFTPYLWVELSIAPDFNSTGFSDKQSGSVRPGINIGFQFHKNIGFSIGAQYNTKRFITASENFNPPAGYWSSNTNGNIPKTIDGSSKIIDFPANLIFSTNNDRKFNWGASAGISSYVVLSEACVFEYSNYSSKNYSWNSKESSTDWASIANFSFFTKWKLRNGNYLTLSPYVKIPIKQIGWGNVNLYSSGLKIGIRRDFTQQKQKQTPK